MQTVFTIFPIYLGIFFIHCQVSAEFKNLKTYSTRWATWAESTQVHFECSKEYQVEMFEYWRIGSSSGNIKLSPENFEDTKNDCEKHYYCSLNVIPVQKPTATESASTSTEAPRWDIALTRKHHFFIQMDLPYSMILGEKLQVIIKLHNREHYRDITAHLTIDASPDFEIEGENPREIHCPRNFGKSVEFWITPLRHGELALQISARSGHLEDALLKHLRVAPGGVKQITRKVTELKATGLEKEAYAVRSELPPKSGVRGVEDIQISLGAAHARGSVGMESVGNNGKLTFVDIFGVNTLADPPTIFQVDTRGALKEFKLPSNFDVIYFAIGGVGSLRAAVTWTYYLGKNGLNSSGSAFSLEVTRAQRSTDKYLELNICARYLLEGRSNMAVMEINLPSGYEVESKGSEVTTEEKTFKCREIKNEGAKIEFYFNHIQALTQTCAKVKATRKFNIENLQEAYVKIFEYSKPNTKVAERFYSAR